MSHVLQCLDTDAGAQMLLPLLGLRLNITLLRSWIISAHLQMALVDVQEYLLIPLNQFDAGFILRGNVDVLVNLEELAISITEMLQTAEPVGY